MTVDSWRHNYNRFKIQIYSKNLIKGKGMIEISFDHEKMHKRNNMKNDKLKFKIEFLVQ